MDFLSGVKLSNVEKYLVFQKKGGLESYYDHLLYPDEERLLILVTHNVVERMLGDMIKTRLSHPEAWLSEADFRSRTSLAYAMGVIAPEQLNICRVLNTARNLAAHTLEPLPDKWRIEIIRLAFSGDSSLLERTIKNAVKKIVTKIGAPWLYAITTEARKNFHEENKERWVELADERFKNCPEPEKIINDKELLQKFGSEINEILARELFEKSKVV